MKFKYAEELPAELKTNNILFGFFLIVMVLTASLQ